MQVPREEFVPENVRPDAYQDRPLAIGSGQTISQPFMVAHMISFLELQGNENVLEIGTGSGYQAAVLSLMCAHVITIERIPELAESARGRLQNLGYHNVEVRLGDGSMGHLEGAPYQGIIVAAAASQVPAPLFEQLDTHGCLVIPIGPGRLQRLRIFTRTPAGFSSRESVQCVFVPLIGKIAH